MTNLEQKTQEFKKACKQINFQSGINYAEYVMHHFNALEKKITKIEATLKHHEEVIAEMHVQNVVDELNITTETSEVYTRKTNKEECATSAD